MVILDGRSLALRLRQPLRLLSKAGVHKVGSETGVVNPFSFFRGNHLRLLLLGSKLRRHGALLPLLAGPARNAGSRGNAGRAEGRGGSLLRGRRRRQRRILRCSRVVRCLLLFLLALGLKLALQVQHVVIGVVLYRRLRRLPFRGGPRRLLAGRTEERRHNYKQCRAQIDKGL